MSYAKTETSISLNIEYLYFQNENAQLTRDFTSQLVFINKTKDNCMVISKKREANDQVGHPMLPERIQSFPKIDLRKI